jgi:hypothetical protein
LVPLLTFVLLAPQAVISNVRRRGSVSASPPPHIDVDVPAHSALKAGNEKKVEVKS